MFCPQGWGYIPEKVKKAHKKIEMYRYDTDAWGILLREAQVSEIEKRQKRPIIRLSCQQVFGGTVWPPKNTANVQFKTKIEPELSFCVLIVCSYMYY